MKGITFSTEMVQAILRGEKTQTRRLHKKQRFEVGEEVYVREAYAEIPYECEHIKIDGGHITIPKYAYKADSECKYSWKSGRFMPKCAARICLQITEVRHQDLQEIDEADAIAEGVKSREEFSELWNRINKDIRWEDNSKVYAYTFKEVKE